MTLLRPHAPDYSPIGPAFSKIKQQRQSRSLKTGKALGHSMRTVINAVTPSDALRLFAHFG